MPQDIPFEGSEVLPFTPDTLKAAMGDDAPAFNLRAFTTRDRRFHRRLQTEEGLTYHSKEAIRAELLNGLRSLWSTDAFERHSPVLKDYWQAQDEFAAQVAQRKAGEPELNWSYDPDISAAVADLIDKVSESWPAVRRMYADNIEFPDLLRDIDIATTVLDWTGLDVPRRLERGYLTMRCVDDLRAALEKAEKRLGLTSGTAWNELWLACTRRMRLDEDMEKNSASPSPSAMTQQPSTETDTSASAGKSRASRARSKKTPATS